MHLAKITFRSLTLSRMAFVSNVDSKIARQIYKQKDYRSLQKFYQENHNLVTEDNCNVDLMRQVVSLGYRHSAGYDMVKDIVKLCADNLHTVKRYNDILMFASVVAHHKDLRDDVWEPILNELEKVIPTLPSKGVRNFVKVLSFWKDKRNFREQFKNLEALFLERVIHADYVGELGINEKLHILGMVINKPEYIDFTDRLKGLVYSEIGVHPVLVRFYVHLLHPKYGISENSFIEPELWGKIEESVRTYPKDLYFISFVC